MLELSQWPESARRGIRGVLTDIDDTLTTEGQITTEARQAISALKQSGRVVIPITGRPSGWSEPFAWGADAQPPLDVEAIVAENGAVALLHPSLQAARGESKLYQQAEALRLENHARMQAVARQITTQVPGARLSEDSPGRETDIAIDHSEFHRLSQEQIAQVLALMRAAGMTATVSSIHINGWYGDHNKLHGACWIVQALYGRDLMAELDQWVYIGDSTNDQLMFEAFPHSFGVANVRDFADQLSHWPRYVTPSERGAGFSELARALLG